MRNIFLCIILLGSAASHAQGVRAIAPLQGYVCMMLAGPDAGSPILQDPSATAPRIGIASAIVIVASPPQP